jgi:hypothetical protein
MPERAPLSPPSRREPEIKLDTVSKRIPRRPGQHRSAPHSDASSKYKKQHETIIAHTWPDGHPIYARQFCPDCGAPVRWLPLRGSTDLIPRCSDGCVPRCTPEAEETPAKCTPEPIRARQYRAFARGRC